MKHSLDRGGHWDFRFCGFGYFFERFFGFCVKRLRFFGFRVQCGLRIFRFSVFVKNTSGFSVLVLNVVFGFSYFLFLFGPIWVYSFGCGFRFWPILFAVLRFWMNFSSVLRFLVYPNAPLRNLNLLPTTTLFQKVLRGP